MDYLLTEEQKMIRDLCRQIARDKIKPVAAKYDTGFMNLNVSYEYSDVFESYDWRKKNHFGIEIGLPLITLYGGINQIYFTYGAEVNLLIFKFKAARYTQELSSFVGMEPNTRYQFFTDISFEL